MVYKVIGLMSGSSLDGLDIVFAEFHEASGKWTYEIKATACYAYNEEWFQKLKNAVHLSALDYQLLHTSYGHYTGQMVNCFIDEHQLQFQVQLIASHGHTTFHVPQQKMTAQLGDGAAIAATTGINVVSDLRALDVAYGGQGAPIVPIGEKLLMGEYDLFLNIGGIANLSKHSVSTSLNNSSPSTEFIPSKAGLKVLAFDVCPANRVLNLLAADAGKEFDEDGAMARSGKIHFALLDELNSLDYYQQPFPKSLSNDFGTETVYPMIKNQGIKTRDALRTYVEHIALQVSNSVAQLLHKFNSGQANLKLLATGGGAFNTFLIERLKEKIQQRNVEIIIPQADLINYKEALIMGLIGVLRWREENNVLASVTGASRDSIGGAVWIGQEG